MFHDSFAGVFLVELIRLLITLFQCASCSYTNTRASQMKQHELSVHSGLRPWKCTHPGCHYAAKAKCNLNQHLKLHESNPELRKPYICTFRGCGYRAAKKAMVNYHVKRRHTTNRTRYFTCSFCSSKFYEKCALNVHIQSHVKEKRFLCHQCNFKTHHPSSLQQHVRNKDEIPIRFTCSFQGCHFSTKRNGMLSKHLQSHNPDPLVRRPNACTFTGCQHRTRYMYELKNYIDACHNPNRVKSKSCPWCLKTYYTQASVNRHVKGADLKEKGHTCNKCSYSAGDPSLLRSHRGRMHDGGGRGIPRFTCDSCCFQTLSKRGLSYHIGKSHPETRKLNGLDSFSKLEKECCRKVPFVIRNRIHVQSV